MFDVVRNNPRVAQLVLALIILPFAFFGIESYFKTPPARVEVASISGEPITVGDFEQALREQQDKIRRQSGGNVDPAQLNSPQVRRDVLDRMINQRVLGRFVSENRFMITDQRLRDEIAAIPAFQKDGKFDMARYEQALLGQGMSQRQFEAGLRGDLALGQLINGISTTGFGPRTALHYMLGLQEEERRVQVAEFTPEAYLGQVKVEPSELQAAYDADKARFQRAERARAEYVVLSREALLASTKVSEEKVRAAYEETKGNYTQPEERRASHILLQVAADAPAADVAKVQERAEQLLAQVKAKPESFAEVARKSSEDPGSASQGGDLGFFGRKAMVKPFEDAAFALKEGEISGLVRSDFGFHIIRLVSIRPAKVKAFEEVAEAIRSKLRQEEAGRQFASQAEVFNNTAYEQPDSLQPVAERFGLPIKESDWIQPGSDTFGEFTDAKLVKSLFSDDVLQKKHNSAAIEIGNDTLVSLRIKTHEPARQLSFDEVKADLEKELRLKKAGELARKDGEAALAALQKGEKIAAKWSGDLVLKRVRPSGLSPDGVKAVFAVSADNLPAYTGVPQFGGGYALLRVLAVKKIDISDSDPRVQGATAQYDRLVGERDFLSLMATLRERYKVKVNEAALKVGGES